MEADTMSDRARANGHIVACHGVQKIYRQGAIEVRALDGIDLEVEPGEFLALAGPSGSGKTTLLNLIGGLDTADGGEIEVEGRKMRDLGSGDLADMRLRRVGFVFQSYNLIPVLSAEENAEFVMMLQGVPAAERRRRAREILDDVGLEGLYDRRPAELSGGQQQRVAVARAIVADPAIVLADEPTANLDSETGHALLDVMEEMNRTKGVTFIFSTHDRMVMDHARRLVYLKDGRVDREERKGS